jgi:hypothetical protein
MTPRREGPIWSGAVLSSVLPVVDSSRHIQVSEEAIRAVARWMAYEEFAPISAGLSPLFPIEPRAKELTEFTMLVNTLNFAFTDFTTSEKYTTTYMGQHFVDSEAMVAKLHQGLLSGTPVTSGAWMATVTPADLRRLFADRLEIPLIDERVAMLREVGTVLVARYEGSWWNWVQDCSGALYDNGSGLLERLASDFPRFNDASEWHGHRVQFMKLGQLGLWTLHMQLKKIGTPLLRDPQLLTAFADYIVPVALNLFDIFRYSPALAEKINSGTEIARDSDEEVELRALSIYAVARLVEEINLLRPADLLLISPQVDYRLWKSYHATHAPHHLTKTVMY